MTAHEAEKRSLVHELHGDLGSSLTALNMHLVLLAQKLPPDPAIAARIEKMKALVLAISESNRRIQLGLRPDKLEVFGLKVALQEAAEDLQQRHGLVCRIDLPDEDIAYSAETDMGIFRMVEAALENVVRHAGASQVQIVLDDDEDAILLTVRDNGRGIEPAQLEGVQTHGLRVLRERAGFLGGTVRIARGRDGGTVLSITLPKNQDG
jgi:signal transduction histidine kinase